MFPFSLMNASVTIGCKLSNALQTPFSHVLLLFFAPMPNEVHRKSDSLSSKWPGVDVSHAAI